MHSPFSPNLADSSACVPSALQKGTSKHFSFYDDPIVNNFINFILKLTEGGATVDFIITLLTLSTAENHKFTTGYSLGWRHLSLQNKFGIKKIKLVTIVPLLKLIDKMLGNYFCVRATSQQQ